MFSGHFKEFSYIARHYMAVLYKRKGSPFFWIEYRDIGGKRCQKSTKLRHAVIPERRKAHALCAEMSASERTTGPDNYGAWSSTWIDRFLAQRYGHTPKTLSRYRGSWRNIAAFLNVKDITVPRQLTRQLVRDFIDWRQERHQDAGCYEASKNTALHEVKLLRIVMSEAVQSGYATVNPCLALGIKRDPSPRKPRITDAEHERITKALEKEPDWMRVSYAIAWEQGCRFSETCLPLSDVDLVRGVIHFRTKGRKDERTEFPLSPRLVPLFLKMKTDGREYTFDMPAMPGKAWWRFFKRIRLSHLCFHCTRVTFVTRCYERSVPKDLVMRLVGHSDSVVHEVYPRLSATHESLQQLRKALD